MADIAAAEELQARDAFAAKWQQDRFMRRMLGAWKAWLQHARVQRMRESWDMWRSTRCVNSNSNRGGGHGDGGHEGARKHRPLPRAAVNQLTVPRR